MNLIEKLKGENPVLAHKIKKNIEYAQESMENACNNFLHELVVASKMLTKSSFDEWIKALNYGRFTQSKYKLYNKIYIKGKGNGNDAYCCLGVFCHINGLSNEQINAFSDIDDIFVDELPSVNGDIDEFQTPFMTLNDSLDFSFREIATIAKWARARRIRKK